MEAEKRGQQMSARIVSVCGVPVAGDVRIYAGDKIAVTVNSETNSATSVVVLPVSGEWKVVKVED